MASESQTSMIEIICRIGSLFLAASLVQIPWAMLGCTLYLAMKPELGTQFLQRTLPRLCMGKK